MEKPPLRPAVLLALGAVLCLYTGVTANLPLLHLRSQLVIFAGLALLYCFLHHPLAQVFRRSRWAQSLDWVLAGISLLVTLYLAWQFESEQPEVHQGMALLGLLLLLEGSRRVMGWALPLLVFLFGVYGIFGSLLPGFLLHRGFSEERLLAQCFLPGQGIFGMALEVTFRDAFLLVAFGVWLEELGGPRYLLQLLERRYGGRPGGAAKVAVLASGLLGAISATPAFSAAITGPFSLPRMRRQGLQDFEAAGTLAAASLGGVLVPPVLGVGAYLMLTLLAPQVSLAGLLAASLLPSLLYFFSLYLSVAFRARRRELENPGPEEDTVKLMLLPELPALRPASAYAGGLLGLGLVALLLPLLAGWPVARAVLPAFALTFVGAWLRPQTRPTWASLAVWLRRSAEAALPLILAAAGVGMVLGVAALTGLGASLQALIPVLAHSGLFPALLVLAGLALLVGLALPSAVVYLLLGLLLGPALATLGPLPLAFHFFLLFFSLMATITPPVANAVTVAAEMAGAEQLPTSLRACRLSLVGFALPFLIIYRPQLLMLDPGGGRAPWLEVLIAGAVAILGTFPLAGADSGYFLRPLGPVARLALLAIAWLIFLPAAGPPAEVPVTWPNLLGVALLGLAGILLKQPRGADSQN